MSLQRIAVGSSALLAGAWLLVVLPGCSASGEGLTSLPCMLLDGGPCPSGGDASDDQTTDGGPVILGGDAGGLDGATARSPLCGVIGCYPGNPSACLAPSASDAASGPIVDEDGGDTGAVEASLDDAAAAPVEASADRV